MKINPVKSSEWNSVTPENVARDIKHHAYMVNKMLSEVDAIDLGKKDKAQLKAIAAEFATIEKRLNWVLNGLY